MLYFQDARISADFNDEDDELNDPVPDKTRAGNRWVKHNRIFLNFPTVSKLVIVSLKPEQSS